MGKINCVIIEDEPLGAEIIQNYIEQVSCLHLVATCSDAILAMIVLKEERVDLIFLDIHLPKIKGLDFLKTLTHPPKVIITTAYGEYALQGYEHNVIDYLLKPIEFSRFLTAINKVQLTSTIHSSEPSKEDEKDYLFFNVNKKKVKVHLDDILYIEGQKEYIKIVTTDKSIVTKLPIGQMIELLPTENFLRVHRSFIVSKQKIEAYDSMEVEIKGRQIPIGRSYKEIVEGHLKVMK
jgi:DNA-binding LytR/AlgR family response regulator